MASVLPSRPPIKRTGAIVRATRRIRVRTVHAGRRHSRDIVVTVISRRPWRLRGEPRTNGSIWAGIDFPA